MEAMGHNGERYFTGTLDRRHTVRFPVREKVRYRVLQSKAVQQLAGAGQTVDMSSGGILFTAKEDLEPGRLIEVAVDWPARLDGGCLLQLVATGHVVRADRFEDRLTIAVRIERYAFKTRAAGTLAVSA
jgi:hypothetical protein